MLFGMTSAKQLLIFRPDVSQYQRADFRDLERSALESQTQFKYIDQIEKLKDYPECDLVIISTSQTDVATLSKDLAHRNIKLWIHPNSGYDNLPQSFVEESDFPIVVGNNIRANGVYLYSVQCLLDAMGPIPFHESWEPTRQFERRSFRQENVLVIGHGHIGQKFTHFLETSELAYQVLDPFKYDNGIDYSVVTSVVVLASLNRTSKHLLNREFFNKLNKDVTIINPARGKIIDELALIEYLKDSPKSKVYLDVFEKEPCEFEKFLFHPHIKLSSHIAGVYEDIDQVIIEHECNVIKDYIHGDDVSFQNKYKSLILRNKIINGILI
jgi:D-3-phosphoglycerate dehydrogenase